MEEYITREEAINAAKSCAGNYTDDGLMGQLTKMAWNYAIENVVSVLKQIPPADVKSVVRGEWEYWAGGLPRCPVCKEEFVDYIPIDNFCPNCGADMRPRENLEAGAEYADADTMMPAT